MKRFLSILPMLVIAVAAARADIIVDQNNSAGVGSGSLNDSFEWQQQVTDGIGGVLAGVELFTLDGTDTVTVSIGLGSGFYMGPFAFTTTAAIGSDGTFIDTSAAGIDLTPGESFVIDVSDGPGCCNLAAVNSLYAGGDLFFNNNGHIINVNAAGGPSSAYSLGFETFIGSSSAPEPGTVALFGSGLASLIWIRRRRNLTGARLIKRRLSV
jgi:hypothetical protein